MAFDTQTKFRAIQRYSAGHVGFSPQPDGAFNSPAEFAAFAGIYPITGGFPTGAPAAALFTLQEMRSIQAYSAFAVYSPIPDAAATDFDEMPIQIALFAFAFEIDAPVAGGTIIPIIQQHIRRRR